MRIRCPFRWGPNLPNVGKYSGVDWVDGMNLHSRTISKNAIYNEYIEYIIIYNDEIWLLHPWFTKAIRAKNVSHTPPESVPCVRKNTQESLLPFPAFGCTCPGSQPYEPIGVLDDTFWMFLKSCNIMKELNIAYYHQLNIIVYSMVKQVNLFRHTYLMRKNEICFWRFDLRMISVKWNEAQQIAFLRALN